MKLELLSLVLPFNTSSPMIRQAAVATCVPSGYEGTGVAEKDGGGELCFSADMLAAELLICLEMESVLCAASCAFTLGRIEVTPDRGASVL